MVKFMKTLLAASKGGERFEELQALRLVLARSITAAERLGTLKDISLLVGKLLDVSREIEQLSDAKAKAVAECIPDELFDVETV
jgi:hypothetical protein